jgi:hypothetical protein
LPLYNKIQVYSTTEWKVSELLNCHTVSKCHSTNFILKKLWKNLYNGKIW